MSAIITDKPRVELFRDLVREGRAKLFVSANAINAVKGGLAVGYANGIIRDYNQEFVQRWAPRLASAAATQPARVEVLYSNWYNPKLDYKTFMVPGILGEFEALIFCFLTARIIVR